MKEFLLKDKVVLITGASGLIGREVADALGSAGASLVLLDIVPNSMMDEYSMELSERHSVRVKNYSADITNVDQISITIGRIIDVFKKIDVLVNLAAIDAKFDVDEKETPKTSFEDFPMSLWKKSLNVNLTGTFNITQQVVREMLKQGCGNIINVASTYSLVSPNQNLYKFNEGDDVQLYKPIDYVATKSAIPNFTRYLATFYGKKGIRVNTIIPHGIINNPSEKFVKNFSKLSPLGRICNKEEIRGPFIFLASNASSYMTGSTLVIDGGWSAW